MSVFESLRIALRALHANKLRSALTMLGMIIGVGAVIAMTSVGAGAQDQIAGQIRGMGTNLIFVRPGSSQQSGVRTQAGSMPTLTYEDAQAIAEPGFSLLIRAVAPELSSFGQVLVGGVNVNTRITGTTPEYEEVRNIHVSEGSFFSRQQIDSRSHVVILGSSVAKTLFGDASAIDQNVKINMARGSVNFRVVGVLEEKGAQAMGSQDDLVLVPLTTLQQSLFAQRTATGGRAVTSVNIQLVSEDKTIIDAATEQIGDLLRQRHRTAEDDFTVQSQADLLSVVGQVTGILTILLASIAGISLVVGGIGIMNIMLVSVTERTREIGIRKAVGAKRRDIMLQFLIESLVVSVVGGAAGMLLGFGLSQIVGALQMGGQAIPTRITLDAVLLATGVSAAIGIFFGIYPASRAARLNPIDALRYE